MTPPRGNLGLASKARRLAVPGAAPTAPGAPNGTPADVLAVLSDATRKSAEEPVLKEALDRLSMGYACADTETFRATMRRDNELFKTLVTKLGIKG